MTDTASSSSALSIRRNLTAGVAVVLMLVGGLGGWAASTDISGAVIASGLLVVASNVKKVQHPTGGIVGELFVREGDHIAAGDVLLRLDETLTRANLAVVTKTLDELTARKARLEAELRGRDTLDFSPMLDERRGDESIAHLMESERSLFEARRASRDTLKFQLHEQIKQIESEVSGNSAQERAKAKEIELVQHELEGARSLWAKNLMPVTKMTALEREATRLEGERSQLVSAIGQTKTKIAETELKILQVDRDLSTEAGKKLRDVEAKLDELVERQIAAQDQLKRIDIRAPQNGVVHQLAVHTVGGVIAAGEQIMLIVPHADKLMIEANVASLDIDQIRMWQPAKVRFSAFNQRSSPELNATVMRVAADAVLDQRTGQAEYNVRLEVPDEELRKFDRIKLVPGMPVEIFFQTGNRTVLSYFLKPLEDQLARTFREE